MIGLISDTHDNIWGIKAAVDILKKRKCDLVIHAGDIIAGMTIQHFKGLPIAFILGNNHMEPDRLENKIREIKGTFLGEWGEITHQGKKIAVIHGHNLQFLEQKIQNKGYDYIITGHTHTQRNEMVGKTRVINPGGLYLGDEAHSIAFLDVDKDIVEFVDI